MKKKQVKYKFNRFREKRRNYLFLIGALVDEIKCEVYVLGKSRSKHILVSSKLMSRLSHYRIYDVQSRYLVLWSTLQQQTLEFQTLMHDLTNTNLLKEFLHRLHNMFVEFDSFDGSFGDGRHFGLRYRRFDIV
jgi:hypothetical protein